MLKAFVSICALVSFSFAANAQTAAQRQDIIFNGKETDLPVQRAYAPTMRSTSDCLAGNGLGVQTGLWGFSVGGTSQARPCNIRENIKLADSLGLHTLARNVMILTICEDKAFKDLPECGKEPEKDLCEYPAEDCKRSKKFDYKN